MSMVLFGCTDPTQPVVKEVAPLVTDGITIKDGRQELLFERQYRKAITDHVEVSITFKNEPYFTGGRYNKYVFGTLRQSDGKLVSFPMYEIAERIIQTELIETVGQAIAEMIAMDKAYIESSPQEFVDTDGNRWMRQGASQ